MKILVEVTVGPGGRLAGSVGTPARPNQHAFGGAMELIAYIERLCHQSGDQVRSVEGARQWPIA